MRSLYPSKFSVIEGHFILSDEEKIDIPKGFENAIFVYGRYLDNNTWYRLDNGILNPQYAHVEKDLKRLATHIKKNYDESQICG
ncbi:hypothetical protein L9W92_16015 [Pelotomaculum terephthalicicum JT]|uniref:hypothetical protein n=1 Tax=Pelotomaculum terephthalicicum TaxID=206393 RepID=UPI001F044056|nr:hypothetical protein [Pelotomaculum terephthalicicum]MCG9969511.1 hypothetical protein [Pelotomaculum terephthalicicum JT]